MVTVGIGESEGTGGIGSRDGPEIRMFKCHTLTVPRESVEEVWIAPVFSTVDPQG
jgi:hypothetical protein